MKLSIFARLVIGYMAIFILAMAVNIYSIRQLRHLEEVARTILFVDNRLIDYEKKLSDVLLSMMRYERKFIILKDDETYNQFRLVRDDFERQLAGIKTLTDSDKVGDLLNEIDRLRNRYLQLFEEELVYLKSGEQYTGKEYELEKESAVNGIMGALKELREYTQQNTYRKVNQLSEADVNASRVAIGLGVVSLIFGGIISVVITLTITRPLSVIKKKTKEIAKGEFGDDLQLSSPPEIAMLTQSFNSMCAKLKEIDKMKSDFFSLMSHELRTPLTTIKEGTSLFIESMDSQGPSDKQRRLLSIINEECNRMINLVNSLLDLSKMEAGMMTYNFTRADLAPLIMKIAGEMGPIAERKNIKIEAGLVKGLPPVTFDTERVLQVLRNLIANAVKFTPDNGHIKIYAASGDDGVKVSVSDTGTGISKDKIDVVFDKYRQAGLSSSNKIQGTGLGLSIVKQIVLAHGGRVWVENTSDQGSTFSFVLPL